MGPGTRRGSRLVGGDDGRASGHGEGRDRCCGPRNAGEPHEPGPVVWLLTHAALVLCPSSADGFGFVPFEAALAGTASLSVSYGPFRELGGETPVWATAWNAVAFADAAQRLLDDPKLGDRQSAARRAVAADLTWDKTASHLVRAFRDVLSRPASSTDEPWPTAQTFDERDAERATPLAQARSAGPRERPSRARHLAARFRRT